MGAIAGRCQCRCKRPEYLREGRLWERFVHGPVENVVHPLRHALQQQSPEPASRPLQIDNLVNIDACALQRCSHTPRDEAQCPVTSERLAAVPEPGSTSHSRNSEHPSTQERSATDLYFSRNTDSVTISNRFFRLSIVKLLCKWGGIGGIFLVLGVRRTDSGCVVSGAVLALLAGVLVANEH